MTRRRLLAVGGVLLALVLGLGLVDLLLPPDLSRLHRQSAVVEDSSGTLLRPFALADGTWRLDSDPARIAPLYLAMLREMEDGRFGWHPGIDPLALTRAAFQAVSQGRVVSGGSTLSMQLARLLDPKPRTMAAKLTEMARAVQLQMRLGTAGVLRAYVTLAPFGGRVEGVRAASLAWFGIEPAHLGPAQAALLAALPQSPERLRPDRHPQAAKVARDRVLDRAVGAGLLSADVAQAAKAEALPTFQRDLPLLAPHLAERLSAEGDKRIRTTIDGNLQRVVEGLARALSAGWDDGAELALLVVANDGRRVLAHVGSGDWRRCQVDLTRASRSPGSTLKPFIYALAFDDLSLHPGTLIEDAPQRFGLWLPRNFDQDSHGVMTAREALQRSLNIPAVLVLDQVGPVRLASLLRQVGAELAFPALAEPSLPLALGGVGMRLVDLVMLYAGLAEDGMVRPLAFVHGAETPAGRSLVGQPAARAVVQALEGSPPPPGVASARLTQRGRAIAFKTGTSYGFRDAWSIGVSRDYTIGVWVGRPDGAPRPGQYGLAAAAPILFQLFDLLPPDQGRRPPPAQPDHALYHAQPPAGLTRLSARGDEMGAGAGPGRPRILFPPDGTTVEALADGIALSAQGGVAPLKWIADGVPLPDDVRFWRPEGDGFSRLVVVDGNGQRAVSTIRVVTGQ
jgi:penicillin-binding protein 1C